jgi:6-phosphogluconolactonase/Glucosamine-6-phosphate isomerase/deaminase
MKITLTKSIEEFYTISAGRIAAAIIEKPEALIGLSTGRTTGGIHKALAELYKEKPFDTSHVSIFGVDEITNMSRMCKASCYYMLLHQVVEPLGIPLHNFIMPDPYAEEMDKECDIFENRVSNNNVADLQILGIGENGHLGFNQPGSPFGGTTWVSYMDDSLDERLRRENNIAADVKMGGLTLGIKNIMWSKKIIMVANGKSKTDIVAKALLGPVTENLPASVLQLHPNCEFILDPEAAGRI